MGVLIGSHEFDADRVIEQLRATSPPEMLAGIEQFKKCSKAKQFELLALQMQHLVAAMANADALLRHVHERVCFVAEDEDAPDDEHDDAHDELELAN